MMGIARTLALAAALAVPVPGPLGAQAPERTVGVLAGFSHYDLARTGTAPVAALRVGLPVGGPFLVEPGIGYLTYDGRSRGRVHHLLPEVQLRVARPGRRLTPYLGLGAGVSVEGRPGPAVTELTVSGATGVMVRLGGGVHLVAELRMRAIDPWAGRTVDWGLGLARRF
jgi:hypothetical protein